MPAKRSLRAVRGRPLECPRDRTARHPDIRRQAEERENGGRDVEEARAAALAPLRHVLSPEGIDAVGTVPEAGRRPVERGSLAGPVRSPFEAVVGVDDQRRAVLRGAPHPLSEQSIDQAIVDVHRAREAAKVFLPNARQTRRDEGREDVADLVGAFQIDGHQIRMIPIVEIARDPLVHARRRHDACQGHDGILHAGPGGERLRDLGLRNREIPGKLRRRHRPVPRDDLCDAGREALRVGHAGEGQRPEEDRARPVGHEEALDLLGRVRRPPTDHAHPQAGGRGEIPDGRNRARAPRNGHFLPGLRVDLLEVEDPVDVGTDPRRRGRPQDGGKNRKEARETAGRLLPRRGASSWASCLAPRAGRATPSRGRRGRAR